MAHTTGCRNDSKTDAGARHDRCAHPLVDPTTACWCCSQPRSSCAWGLVAVSRTPLDAIPDLSDVQVIVRTTYPGQAPQVVEDQVTYPLTTTLLSVPHAKTVRGYSLFGESFVYVLFDDGTDLYWARSRVLEYLSQVQSRLAGRCNGRARSGRNRSRLDLRICVGRSQRPPRHRRTARAAGLVPEVSN